ncbi:MAG: choline ABC transporter substrate-binding protein [Saccharospirillum sp.]|uniref:choline ABC transporter substrate-binding protein n=1 Tax=Saccharospirillum sp. TaxID=2033801 RepID=UPI00329787C1
MKMRNTLSLGTGLVALCALGATVQADVAESCRSVHFSDPGWTDINVTNAVATTLLEGLGYETDVDLLAVPIGFESLQANDIDVFLGNWMPAQQAFADKYADGYEQVRANLEGAKFTLAVPEYVQEAGVESFADLADHADAFDRRIYGIDPGAPANSLIQSMIDAGDFGLSGWELVESSEQGMLSQVDRAARRDEFVVFLAWEPHPMNLHHDLAYLTGGDDYFGPNLGGATIYTLTRNGYRDECQNAGRLLTNLVFTLEMENQIMSAILDDGETPEAAARAWLASNTEVLPTWLDGVTTVDGSPGLAAVEQALSR